MLEHFLYALKAVFLWQNILFIIVGTAIGMVFGALPGLTVTLAVALTLPFTFSLTPESAIVLLTGVYCAGTYAGSISAILINTPGTPSSVATAWDGYPLTLQGRSFEALNVALYASVLGGLISAIALIFFAPILAKTALRFGPPERFALTFFGLTIISRVSGKSLMKGLVSALFGLLIATVGIDPIMGSRMTAGHCLVSTSRASGWCFNACSAPADSARAWLWRCSPLSGRSAPS